MNGNVSEVKTVGETPHLDNKKQNEKQIIWVWVRLSSSTWREIKVRG